MTQKGLWISIALIVGGFAMVMAIASPGLPVVILLIVSAFVAALFWLFWFFGENIPLRRFQPLKERLGFKEGPDLLEPLGRYQDKTHPDILTGAWRGHKVQIQYHSFRRDERASLSIHILHSLPEIPTTIFRQEGLLHRLAKGSGLSREADSPDPLFNQRVYVESDRDEALQGLLASADLRRGILGLLEISKATVALTPETVGITIHGHWGWPRYFQPEKIQEILERLFSISKSLKGTHFSPSDARAKTAASVLEGDAKTNRLITRLRSVLGDEEPALSDIEGRTLAERFSPQPLRGFPLLPQGAKGKQSLMKGSSRMAIFVACLLMFLGPILFIWSLRYQTLGWKLPGIGLALAAISFLLYLPFLYFFARGRSQSHRFFFSFIIPALIGFPSFWVGSLRVANGLFDKNRPFVVMGQVIGRDREKPRLEVWVESPRHGSVFIRVSQELYHSLSRGTIVPVHLSPGALGEPWVVPVVLSR